MVIPKLYFVDISDYFISSEMDVCTFMSTFEILAHVDACGQVGFFYDANYPYRPNNIWYDLVVEDEKIIITKRRFIDENEDVNEAIVKLEISRELEIEELMEFMYNQLMAMLNYQSCIAKREERKVS